jgi:hypothetical protein
MNKLAPIAFAALAAGGLVAACTVNSTTNNNGTDGGPIGDDSGTPDNYVAPSDAAGDVTPEAAPPPSAGIRFANWSPDAPSVGYDLCIALHGTTAWQGPLLSQEVGDAGVIGDSGTSSLQFPTLTNYFELDFPSDAGTSPQFDFEIVAEGSTCTAPLSGTSPATDLPTLTNGGFYTIAIVGDTSTSGTNDPGLKIVGPSIASADFGTGSEKGTNFSALLTGVGFGTAASTAESDAGTVDPNGYLTVPAASGLTFSVHPSMQTVDTAVASGQTIAGGDITTMVLVGAKSGVNFAEFLVCKGDGAVNATSNSLLSNCTTVTM